MSRFQNQNFQAPAVSKEKALAKQTVDGINSLMSPAAHTYQKFLALVGSPRAVEAIKSNVLSIVNSSPMLAQASPHSILGAAVAAARNGLEISPTFSQCAIVPRRNNKTGQVEAMYQTMKRGIVQLTIRSDEFKTCRSGVVFTDEFAGQDFFTGKIQIKFPKAETSLRTKAGNINDLDYAGCKDKGVHGWYAFFILKNGFEQWVYWTIDECQAHGRMYSDSYKKDLREKKATSWWSKHFAVMADKSVLRNLLMNWGPMSTQRALEDDMKVFNSKGEGYWGDNQGFGDDDVEEYSSIESEYDGEYEMPNGEIVGGEETNPDPEPMPQYQGQSEEAEEVFNPF